MASQPSLHMQPINGLKKAAILLVSIGQEASAGILKHLPEEDAEKLVDAIARLDRVSPEDTASVLTEYNSQLENSSLLVGGGLEYAREMLSKAFGAETATRLLDRLVKSLEQDAGDFRHLGKVDPRQLARFIQDEHPQTIAVIVSNLDASQAASLLRSLPAEIRAEVAMRVATIDQISPEIVRAISNVVRRKLGNLGELSRESCGGLRATANIFNRMGGASSSELLDELGKLDPKLSDNIKRLMFVFSDLKHLEMADLREVLSRVDKKVLTLALKGVDEGLVQKFAQCLSGRAAEMLREDMDALGSPRPREIDAAQQEVILAARKLEQEGIISLRNPADEQQ